MIYLFISYLIKGNIYISNYKSNYIIYLEKIKLINLFILNNIYFIIIILNYLYNLIIFSKLLINCNYIYKRKEIKYINKCKFRIKL